MQFEFATATRVIFGAGKLRESGLTLKNGAGLLLEASATVTLPGAPDPFT